jgi:hypothetical protein
MAIKRNTRRTIWLIVGILLAAVFLLRAVIPLLKAV